MQMTQKQGKEKTRGYHAWLLQQEKQNAALYKFMYGNADTATECSVI